MIELSLAEVAELVGRRADRRPRRRRSPAKGDLDSRAVAAGRPVRRAWRGSGSTGTTSSRAAAAAGAVARPLQPARTTGCPASSSPTPWSALGRLAAGVHARLTAGGLRTLAITGSSGKTSTKDLLGQVLAAAGPTVSPPGSFNNDIGLPLTVLDADEDTRYLVLEMGSRGPGHIARLCGVARPQVGVVLNVGSAHLGEFGSPEGIARAKGELVEALPEDGTAVLNADDPRVLGMAARTRARVLTTGTGEDADVRATRVTLDELRPRPLHPRRGGGGAPGRAAGGRGSTRWPTPCRPPARHWPPAWRPADDRRRAVRGRLAQPLADGGGAPRRRGDRGQRRLQRQPRVDAGRPRRTGRAGGGAADRRPRRHGRTRPRRGRRTRAARPRRGRRRGGPGRGRGSRCGRHSRRSVRCRGSRRRGVGARAGPGRCPRAAVGPAPTRGRRPRQGQPLLRAGAARRRSARPQGPAA